MGKEICYDLFELLQSYRSKISCDLSLRIIWVIIWHLTKCLLNFIISKELLTIQLTEDPFWVVTVIYFLSICIISKCAHLGCALYSSMPEYHHLFLGSKREDSERLIISKGLLTIRLNLFLGKKTCGSGTY